MKVYSAAVFVCNYNHVGLEEPYNMDEALGEGYIMQHILTNIQSTETTYTKLSGQNID